MKKTKYLLLGAGRMSRGAIHYLATHDRGAPMHLVDISEGNIRQILKTLPRGLDRKLLRYSVFDLENESKVRRLMSESVAVISAAHYRFNRIFTRLAIGAQCHMVDLGGNLYVVRDQLRLAARAREAGVTIIPDTGLAPGMTNLLALWGALRFSSIDSIRIRVGGVPLDPVPPLNYMLVFSPEGLINEYIEDAMILRDGKVASVPSLADVETLFFPPPFGKMEAFTTSGGSSTLVDTLRGKVRRLDYKTIRYPGHCAIMQGLRQVGLMGSRPVTIGGGGAVSPRQLLGALLEQSLPGKGDDAVLVRVIVEGRSGGRRKRSVVDLFDRLDRRTGLSAMMRCTAFPAACIAQMLADGVIRERGVLRQEETVPSGRFVAAMRRAGLAIRISSRTLAGG